MDEREMIKHAFDGYNVFDQVADLQRLRPKPRTFPYRPSYCLSTVLFLDFDGVLHPADGFSDKGDPFSEIDRLEALLGDYPEVAIVFATSWQLLSSVDRLKTVFRTEYRDRVLGGTGSLEPESYSAGRGRLAEMWMARHGAGQRWLSLDDDARAFPYRHGRVLWCSERHGYGHDEDALLRAWLETRQLEIQDFIAARVPADPADWTARDAIAVAHQMDGWVDVSRVPQQIRDSFRSPESGTTWPLSDWAQALTAWQKWGMNPLWDVLRDRARVGPPLPRA